jgi:TonB family protein
MIVLAGLIKSLRSTNERRIPFLSKVPIMGILFRSRANPVPESDLELVIALTPHILRQKETMAETKTTQEAKGAQTGNEENLSRRRAQPYYSGIPKEMTEYVSEIQRKISQSIVYPQEARDYGWEGTVKLGMLILKDGTLAFALVKESSGHDVFDEVALNTAKKLAHYSPFPSETDLQELNITLPIVYNLKNTP